MENFLASIVLFSIITVTGAGKPFFNVTLDALTEHLIPCAILPHEISSAKQEVWKINNKRIRDVWIYFIFRCSVFCVLRSTFYVLCSTLNFKAEPEVSHYVVFADNQNVTNHRLQPGIKLQSSKLRISEERKNSYIVLLNFITLI